MRRPTAKGIVRLLKSLYSRNTAPDIEYPIDQLLQQPPSEQPDITEDMLLAFRLQLEETGIPLTAILENDDTPKALQSEPSIPDTRQRNNIASSSDAPPPPPECPICLEQCADQRFSATTCDHTFCADCMVAFLTVIATQTHQYPPRCPLCRVNMDTQACLSLLARAPETSGSCDALEMLMLEREHHDNLRYCANSTCSAPFEWVDEIDRRQFSDCFRVTCPLCKQQTCVQCRVIWHAGVNCDKFQEDMQEADDIAKLVAENGWQMCPGCGFMVEKDDDGCNFVKCRCSCGFCYKCGKKYLSLERTPQHVHGEPDCQCGLFG